MGLRTYLSTLKSALPWSVISTFSMALMLNIVKSLNHYFHHASSINQLISHTLDFVITPSDFSSISQVWQNACVSNHFATVCNLDFEYVHGEMANEVDHITKGCNLTD